MLMVTDGDRKLLAKRLITHLPENPRKGVFILHITEPYSSSYTRTYETIKTTRGQKS